MASQLCQNYHQDCEDAVNKQINMELYSSYVYLSMSFYFDRDDVALRHFAEFFKEQSHEECEHAEKLMEFQNRRGGRIILVDIKKPEQDEWSNGLEAMQRALQMEKNVNQSLLDLHKLSTERTDPHLSTAVILFSPGSATEAWKSPLDLMLFLRSPAIGAQKVRSGRLSWIISTQLC
uniref:ferritin heavy chain, oocyte isoform-like n=1 Tax=Pristiophorus japonicus TaxID=55135 RepID=UPI00398EE9C3